MSAYKKSPATYQSNTGDASKNQILPRLARKSNEQLLLSCQLIDVQTIPLVASMGVKPQDFAQLGHSETQRIIRRQFAETGSVCLSDLLGRLTNQIGGEVFPAGIIAEIVVGFIPRWNWPYFAKLVMAASYARTVRANAMADLADINQLAESGSPLAMLKLKEFRQPRERSANAIGVSNE